MNRKGRETVAVSIDMDDVLEKVYAASAWHAVGHDGCHVITPDNAAMLRSTMREAFDDLRTRAGGYIALASYNPDAAQGNVRLTFELRHKPPLEFADELSGVIEQMLANFVLFRHHGADDGYFYTAWRKYRAQLMLMFARDNMD